MYDKENELKNLFGLLNDIKTEDYRTNDKDKIINREGATLLNEAKKEMMNINNA